MLGGHIRVTINGVVVADDDDFGLERSALGLLRTIEQDHDSTSDPRAFDVPALGSEATYSGPVTRAGLPTLLIHDCGFPLTACSNFYVDWSVRHDGEEVVLSDACRFDSLRPTEQTFPEASCVVPGSEYRAEIVQFARAVREAYFADGDKVIDDPDDRSLYHAFWAEYDALLARHADGSD
jgi:hypothetical protein